MNSTHNHSHSPKQHSKYVPNKLSPIQKSFGQYRPVKGFHRFGKEIIADTGEDPSKAYARFIRKDMIKPLARPAAKEAKYKPDTVLKWTVGCTKKCSQPEYLPKNDPYMNYHYAVNSQDEIEKYKRNFLSTDHIGIRVPEINKTYDNNSFLSKKQQYGTHSESKCGWIPKCNDNGTVGNRNSVSYNIINNSDYCVSGAKSVGMLDRTVNNRRKGIAEFNDFARTSNPNFNEDYRKLYEKDSNMFMRYKGIFSELYDAAWKNGNIYLPFRQEGGQKRKEERKGRNYAETEY